MAYPSPHIICFRFLDSIHKVDLQSRISVTGAVYIDWIGRTKKGPDGTGDVWVWAWDFEERQTDRMPHTMT